MMQGSLEDSCRTVLTVSEKGENRQVYYIGRGNERKNIHIAKETLRCLSLPEALIEFVGDRPGHDFTPSTARRYTDLAESLKWASEDD